MFLKSLFRSSSTLLAIYQSDVLCSLALAREGQRRKERANWSALIPMLHPDYLTSLLSLPFVREVQRKRVSVRYGSRTDEN